jgi:hypothetical protein
MSIYKCLSTDFHKLKKRINRITKKLDKHGKSWTFELISMHPERVKVVDMTNHDNIPSWQFQPKTKEIITEVATYRFEMEPLKLGDYKVIAIIEHGKTKDDKNVNIIHALEYDHVDIEQYRHAPSRCNHCNINRHRNKTVLLLDNITGDIIQVGMTCLHEYTGIDCLDVIQAYQDATIVINEKPQIDGSYINNSWQYEETLIYLASCIQEIEMHGYEKEVTKTRAWNNIEKRYYEPYINKAQEVIDYFTSRDFDDYFLRNIKSTLSHEYAKSSGLVAYAYIAYQKDMEREKQREIEREIAEASKHVGNVKDRITVKVELYNQFTYETNYSYYGELNYIHIFIDEEGNQYKWKTQNALIDYDIGDELIITGTIKAHGEYKGVKLTELTRCKIV